MTRGFSRFLSLLGGLSLAFAIVARAEPRDPAKNNDIPPFVVPPVNPNASYERFMVFGDMGTGRPDQYRVAAAMTQRAKSDGLDFMLTVGDNFYEVGVSSVNDPQFKTKFEDVYADPVLQVFVYPSLGNHDHHGNILAQVEYSSRNPNWKMPATHYSFTRTLGDGTTAQFFAIDTNPIKAKDREAAEQIQWLERELAESKADWKFVYGHHPLYSHVDRARAGERRTMIAALEPVFIEQKVDVYFAGHDHTLEMLKPVAGVNYVISGGGAGPERAYGVEWTDQSYYTATLGGFALCRLSKDELVIEFVRVGGRTEYAHTMTKQPLQARGTVKGSRG